MSDAYDLIAVKLRHEKLRALGLCINGPLNGKASKRGRVHGRAHKGGRCLTCWEQKLENDTTRYWQAKARAA